MNKTKKLLLTLPLVLLLFGCKKRAYTDPTTQKPSTSDNQTTKVVITEDDATYYSINYVLNGGTNHSANPKRFKEGTTVNLADPTKEGYDFVCWSTNESGNSPVDVIDLDTDWTIYAIFTPHEYSITYHNLTTDLINSNPTAYTVLDSNFTLFDITNENIDFKGWYTTSTFDENSLITTIDVSSLKNYDLYAKYDIIKQAPTYEITPTDNTYNGTSFELVSASVTGGEITYSLDNVNFSKNIPTAVNVGDYKVYYKITGDEYHTDVVGSIIATINKAKYELTGITFTGDTITYDGEIHRLAIDGTLPDGVEVSYENNDNKDAGSHEVVAVFTIDDDNYYIESMTATLTIEKATYTITFNDASKVYNGEAQIIEVSNLPEGLTVEYTGSGTNVGDYNITATFTNSNPNYNDVAPITRKLTITKATYSLDLLFEGAEIDYDGKYHKLEVKGDLPEGLTISYENNNQKDAGEYLVVANFINSNPNYNEVSSMEATLKINPISADYLLPSAKTGLVYTGNELELIDAGEMIDAEGHFEYRIGDGAWSENIPTATNAGNYTVEYKLVLSGNYDEVEGGTIDVTIAKAIYDLTGVKFENASKVYNGLNQSINTYSGTLPQGVEISYSGSGKEVGEYTITANFTGDVNNYELIDSMKATLTITNATMTNILVEGYHGKADDNNHEAVVSYTATTVDSSSTTWKFSSDGINYVDESELLVSEPGTYTYYYEVKANNHATATGTFTVVISDKDTPELAISNLDSLSKTYDGNAIIDPVIAKNSDGAYEISYSTDDLTYTTEKPVDAGHYYIKVVLEETHSYSARTIKSTFDIAKADYVLNIEFNSKTVTYDGNEHTITITGTLPTGVTVSYTGEGINAGDYTITAKFSHNNPNYNAIDDITANLTIEKADYVLTGITFTGYTVTYNGEVHKLAISGTLPEGVTVSYENNNNKNAGSHQVIARYSGDLVNHNAITRVDEATLVIDKATYDLSGITFENASKVYTGLAQTLTISGTLPETLEVSYEGSGINVGDHEITAIFTNLDNNYNDVESITKILTITKATYDMSGVKLLDKPVDYNGSEQGITITGTLPSGVTVSYTGLGTDAGTYTITAIFTGDSTNYYPIPNLTATLTINKVNPSYTKPTNLVAKVGSTLANVTLPAGFTWNDPTTTSVGNVGENSFVVTYTPTDTANYNTIDDIEVIISVREAYVITASNQSSTYNAATISPNVSVSLGSTTITSGYDLSYEYKLTTDSTYTTGLPKNAGTYNIKIKCTGGDGYDADEVIITYTINKAKLTINTSNIALNYSSSGTTWDSLKSTIASKIDYSGKLGSDSITLNVTGMHNGKYKYGTVSGTYILPTSDTTLFDSSYSNVIGSTYLVYVSSGNENYEVDSDYQILLKYKTAKISSTYYTVEDALAASGTITFEGNSSSDSSYITTAFSSLSTTITGYNTTYTVSNRTIIVPYTNSTTSYSDVEGVTTGNVYSTLIINNGITLNLTNNAVITAAAQISKNQPDTTISTSRGVIINNGTINLASGCTINGYGYIKGDGNINLSSGSTAMDCFHTYDWPGGNTALAIYKSVLPLNAWSLHNISCEVKINSGATYKGHFYTDASSQQIKTDVTIIASSGNALFLSKSGYIIKKAANASSWASTSAEYKALHAITGSNQIKGQKDIIELYGTVNDSSISISAANMSITTSTSISCPISYQEFYIKEGANVTISASDYLFLPGSKMVVEEGATLTTNSGVDLSFEKWANVNGVSTHGSSAFVNKCVDKTDALLIVNGTFTCKGNLGGLITTESENATLDLTNATLTSSFLSLVNEHGASQSGSSNCAYQIKGLPAQGYINNTSTIYAFTKTTYTSAKDGNKYYFVGTQGTANPGNGTMSLTCSVSGSCLLATTEVMLYDGTTKLAKDLTTDDIIVSFNNFTGKFEASKIAFEYVLDYDWFNIIELTFENGKVLRLAKGHGLFNMTTNKYEIYYLNEFENHIGETFATVDYVDGEFVIVGSKLISVAITTEYVQIYSPVSEYNIDLVADGILTIPDDIEGMYDIFSFDSSLTINIDEFMNDVAQYGVFEYEEVKDIVPEYLFDVVNFKYFKTFILKGVLTIDQVNHWIEAYLPCIIELHDLDFDFDNREILSESHLYL